MKDQVVEEFKEQTSQVQECPRHKSEGKAIYDYVKKAYLGFLYLLTIAYLIKTVQT